MINYIVRNCPAFVLMRTATSGTYFNICGTAKGNVECRNCTDCPLKRIVELCREQKTVKYNIDGKEQILKAHCHTRIGDKILEQLEIEEVK